MDKKLPPEVWSNIIKYIKTDKEVLQLRLVSSCLRNIVDNNHVFKDIDLNGNQSSLLPHAQAKIESVKTMVNFNCLLQFPDYQLNRLKTVKFTGPCHPMIVQKVLDASVQLQEIEIESDVYNHCQITGFDLPGLVPRLQDHNNKIKKLRISKSFNLDTFMSTTTGGAIQQMTCEAFCSIKFVELLKLSLLHPVVNLPILNTLYIQYYAMDLFVLHDLVNSTIIPFIKRHVSSLQIIQILLSPLVGQQTSQPVQFQKQIPALPFARNNNAVPVSMPALIQLKLKLPEAVLNGVLVSLFDLKNDSNFIPCNKLTHLLCEFGHPLVHQGITARSAEPNQDQEAIHILQSLIFKNAQSLVILRLENFASNQILLFDRMRFSGKSFENLQEMGIGGRQINLNLSGDNPDQKFQTVLLEQRYPKLGILYLHLIGLKMNLLTSLVWEGCPRLTDLTLTKNIYYEDCRIDDECLSLVASKQGMVDIWVGKNDLIRPFQHPYWNTFKDNFAHFHFPLDINDAFLTR